MSQFFQIHPVNPQPRLIRQAIASIRDGSVVVYPTDSSYALGCLIGDKDALDRIRRRAGADADAEGANGQSATATARLAPEQRPLGARDPLG